MRPPKGVAFWVAAAALAVLTVLAMGAALQYWAAVPENRPHLR